MRVDTLKRSGSRVLSDVSTYVPDFRLRFKEGFGLVV
jgi:hypothetical protein